MNGAHALDLLVVGLAGFAAGLLFAGLLDRVEAREAAKITATS